MLALVLGRGGECRSMSHCGGEEEKGSGAVWLIVIVIYGKLRITLGCG